MSSDWVFSRPVHVTHFMENPTQVMSASDDKTCRITDISSSGTVVEYREHKVRSWGWNVKVKYDVV